MQDDEYSQQSSTCTVQRNKLIHFFVLNFLFKFSKHIITQVNIFYVFETDKITVVHDITE